MPLIHTDQAHTRKDPQAGRIALNPLQQRRFANGHPTGAGIALQNLRTGRPTSTFCILLLLTLTLPLALFSDSSLSEKSPFLPPGHGAKAPEKAEPAVQPQGPISREIEFRGIVKMDGIYQFSLTNKKDQKSYWLKENESEAGIAVSNYDPNSSSIVVLMNGRSERLTLMEASEIPMSVTQSKPANAKQARPAVLPPQLQNNNTNSDNRRRVVPRRRTVVLPKKTN